MTGRTHLPERSGGIATAEAGLVLLDGPNGIAVSMTPDAADDTALSLTLAAKEAREQKDRDAQR